MFRPNHELDGYGSSKRPRLDDDSPHYRAYYRSSPTAATNSQASYYIHDQYPAGYGLTNTFNNPLDNSTFTSDNDGDDELDENLSQSLGLDKYFFKDISNLPSPNSTKRIPPQQSWNGHGAVVTDGPPPKPAPIRMSTVASVEPPPPPPPPPLKRSHEVVDLTEDDDDLIFVTTKKLLPPLVANGFRQQQLHPAPGVTDKVIYGTLRHLQVDLYCVPHSKEGTHLILDENTNSIMWPAIPVSFNKPPPFGTTSIIGVNDAKRIQFGFLYEESAKIIGKLWEAGFEDIEAWMYPRPHKEGEKPEGRAEGLAKLFCNVYGPEKDAKRIAGIATKANMRFDMPTRGFAKSLRYINPHNEVVKECQQSQIAAAAARSLGFGGMSNGNHVLGMAFSGTPGGPGASMKKEQAFWIRPEEYKPIQTSYQSYQARGDDEIKKDVQKIFDDLEATENMPEHPGNPLIKTPLIKHQKQGLHFMTEHEKPRRWKEDGTEVNGLWKRIEKRKGSGRYEYKHIITQEIHDEEPPLAKGGMLADMMGLGKTLQILSLITGSLDEAKEFANGPKLPTYNPEDINKEELYPPMMKSKGTLLIAPLSTITNWEEQIQAHIVPKGVSYLIWHGSARSKDAEEVAKYDIVITTYTLVGIEYRAHLKDQNKNFGPLQKIKWFRIVLDEAHTIREAKASLSKATISLEAERRWAVTGTPIQNRLDDFYSLLKFLRFNPFDQKSTFMVHIHTPIKNGDERVLPSLRALVHAMCIRRLKDKIDLPPREDVIEFVKFDPIEQHLHDVTMEQSAKKIETVIASKNLGGSSYIGVLQMIMRLRLICAHGRELLGDEDFSEFEGTSSADAIDIDAEPAVRPAMTTRKAFQIYRLMQETGEDICFNCRKKCASNTAAAAAATAGFDTSSDDEEEYKPKPKGKGKNIKKETKKPVKDESKDGEADDDFGGFLTPCAHLFCRDCLPSYATSASPHLSRPLEPSDHYTCPLCKNYQSYMITEIRLKELAQHDAEEQKRKKGKKQIYNYHGPSPKVKALIQALLKNRKDSEIEKGDRIKSIVFSSWTTHLDLIAMALEKEGIRFVRLDGGMARKKRSESMRLLREDKEVEVMLVSLLAGGLGLNLTSASRVYMMEPHYNPAAEAQAVDRIHRLGQKRPVKCVRYIMKDSFELKILELQKKKTELANLTFSHGKKLSKEQMSKQKLEELKSLFK